MIVRLRRWLDLLCGPTPLVPGMWWFGRAHRSTILTALEDAARYRLRNGDCGDCPPPAIQSPCKCDDHAADAMTVRRYDDLAACIRGRHRRTRSRLPRQFALAQVEDAMLRAETEHITRQVH